MFFTDEHLNFFKPLVSKYREQIVKCLVTLYRRQYGVMADYAQPLNRDQLIEVLEECLAASASLVLDFSINGEDGDQRFKSHREQARWVLKTLLDCGWIERQVDHATLQSAFPFTRMGRVFSLSFIESDTTQIRTRHRNTRNTLNALEAFLLRGEVYDLLDAYEYSERIITDFTDVISELEERKRQLVREVESQQLAHQATDQFFDFMEKRFQPDISVRLSADSVEKHRADIAASILKIRRKPTEFKKAAEQKLRSTLPDLCGNDQSYLWFILDNIDQRMNSAADIMLPALRRALHGFTKRADIIIRQLSYLNSQHNNDLLEVCKELVDLPEDEFSIRMDNAAKKMSVFKLQLVDPSHIKASERKDKLSVDSSVREHQAIDNNAQRDLMIQQLLDQAFIVNNQHVMSYVKNALRHGQRISTRHLPVDSAMDLLAMAHVIEVGAINNTSSDYAFSVTYTGHSVDGSAYYKKYDEFTIELIERVK